MCARSIFSMVVGVCNVHSVMLVVVYNSVILVIVVKVHKCSTYTLSVSKQMHRNPNLQYRRRVKHKH